MASLEKRYDGRYRVIFYWQSKKFVHSLGKVNERDANACRLRLEDNLRLLERGILEMPHDADLGTFLISGGKLNQVPTLERPMTLGELLKRYRAEAISGAKEKSTRYTEDIHLDHFLRIVGHETRLPAINASVLQNYIRKRSTEKNRDGKFISHVTIKKEIGSLGAVWNKWALPLELVAAPAPTRNLQFRKTRRKLPFQTWEQIERRIGRGGLDDDEQGEFWESVFLNLVQIDELLQHVRASVRVKWVNVMFSLAAYTGARRSELLRSQVDDCDFEAGVVSIREKKKDHSTEMTFRTVPMATKLREVLEEWFRDHHPGGQFTLATAARRPITAQRAAKAFRTAVADSKWEVLSGYHVLRHSFASNCCLRGVDPRLIDAWLGHQTEEMRLRYQHLFPNQQMDAMRSVFG